MGRRTPFGSAYDRCGNEGRHAAIPESFSARLLASGQANVLSQRQWAAALRERNVAARAIKTDDDARGVGLQLGADQLIVGSFTAAWPDVKISARRLATTGSKSLATVEVSGHVEDLPQLEAKVAKALFTAGLAKAARAPTPPRSVYAWHDLSECRDTLALQSMGPRAEPWLPTALVQRAHDACARAEKADKKLVEATAFRALAMFLLDKKDDGKKLATKALQKRRDVGWVDQVAYYTASRSGDAAGAEKILRAAIKKRPGFLHARTTLGESLAERGELDEATKVFEASLAEAKGQPWVLVQLSKVQARKGAHDEAIKTVDQALANVKDDPILLMEKASRQIDAKRFKDAEATLRHAMKQDPGQAATYLRLGYIYLQTDQLALAGPILEKALFEADLESEARVRGYAHFDLAKLAARNKKTAKARTHVEKAVAAGLRDRARFEKDPDLGPLLKDPAFATIFKP
jgi:tetratricopeptide (TPR) repeat protein